MRLTYRGLLERQVSNEHVLKGMLLRAELEVDEEPDGPTPAADVPKRPRKERA